MAKRVIIFGVVVLIIVLGAYIYYGMNWAQKSNQVNSVDTTEDFTQFGRLQKAGAMSEESRLQMVEKLKNAE